MFGVTLAATAGESLIRTLSCAAVRSDPDPDPASAFVSVRTSSPSPSTAGAGANVDIGADFCVAVIVAAVTDGVDGVTCPCNRYGDSDNDDDDDDDDGGGSGDGNGDGARTGVIIEVEGFLDLCELQGVVFTDFVLGVGVLTEVRSPSGAIATFLTGRYRPSASRRSSSDAVAVAVGGSLLPLPLSLSWQLPQRPLLPLSSQLCLDPEAAVTAAAAAAVT
jgi:hypothetical protein